MKRRTSLAVGVVGMFGLLLLVGPVSAADRGARMGEANERYFFTPVTQYANVGDSVTWTNGTDVAHTVASDSGGELASDQIADGKTFDHTFTAQGTFAYHCTIHPYMIGKIVVLAAGAALPATDTAGQSAPSSTNTTGLLILVSAGLVVGGLSIRRFRRVPRA